MIKTTIDKESSSKEEDSLKDINKDIIKYTPGKVLGMLMNLAEVPIYTNLLLPKEYGMYGISIGFLSFMAIIFSDWVGLSALRFLKEYDNTNKINRFFSSILFLILSNLALMYFLTYFFSDKILKFFNLPQENYYLVLFLIIPVALRALMLQVLRAQIKPLTYTAIVLINQFTTIGFAVCFIRFFGLDAKGILMGMMVSISMVDIVLLFLCKLGRYSQINLINRESLVSFYKYGIPIAISSFGMWIITQSNKFIMQHYKGAEYNAFTGVGYNLTYSLLMPLFAIIVMAGIPRIINRYEAGLDVKRVITTLTGYFFIVFSPLVFVICYFPKEIILLFSNEKYIGSAQIIPLLALSAMFYGLAEFTVIQYHLVKKTYIYTLIRVLPNIAGIFLTIFLIQLLSEEKTLMAVGVSALISQVLYFAASIIINIKGLSWLPPYKTIIICIISLVAGFWVMLLFNTPLLQALALIVIYIIMMKWLLKFKTI